jgi:CBS domain-containing protein
MPFLRAGQLARPTPTARPDDPLGLVAENLRASSYGTIPVLDRLVVGDGAHLSPEEHNARVLGLVDERDLSHAVMPTLAQHELTRREAQSLVIPEAEESTVPSLVRDVFTGVTGLNGHGTNGYHPPDLREPVAVAGLTARDAMRQDIGIVPAAFSLHNALLTLDRYDSSALPVVDEQGRYRGMISRADVVAALGRNVRPPVVGGMATPLGVWLTTGNLSAGAPPLGLFLSGVAMAFCFLAAQYIMLIGLTLLNPTWAAMFQSGRLGVNSEIGGSFNFLVTLLHGLVFLLVLRALPMSGIHAAEHQTVWAIERGLPLIPEYVEKMPRAHPRCGTNLVALAGLITITFRHLPDFSPSMVLITLLFIYLAWRSFGTFLQEWFTTRPATRKQLESGIRAGQALLDKYQEQPHVMASFGMRLLNSGIVYSALGLILTSALAAQLEIWVSRLWGG